MAFDWNKLDQLGAALAPLAQQGLARSDNELMSEVFAINPNFGAQLYGAKNDRARTQLDQTVANRDIERQEALKKLATDYNAGQMGLDQLIAQGSTITGDLSPLATLAANREKQAAEAARIKAIQGVMFGGSAPYIGTPPVAGQPQPNAPLNVRNNNAGNIRDPQTGDFKQFSSPQEGLAAMASDLNAKISGNSPAMKSRFGEGYVPTLSNVINTWAPPTENDTQGYVDFVSKKTGIPADKPLSPLDIQRVMPAMIEMEGGPKALEHFATTQPEAAQPVAQEPAVDNPALRQLAQLAAVDPDTYGDDYMRAQVEDAQATAKRIDDRKKAESEGKQNLTKGEQELRKEFEGLPDVKQFREVEGAYKRISKAATNPSAAGDIALIFNYMKMLDPGSTVREGEFATAQNAAGVPVMIQNQWNKLVDGERLAPEQRTDFLSQAKQQYLGAEELFTVRADQYEKLAGAYEYQPDRIVTRARQEVNADSAAPDRMEGLTATGPNGQKVIRKGGKWLPL